MARTTDARTDATTGPDLELLADERLTAIGLFVEAAAGINHRLTRELDEVGISPSSFEVLMRLARSEGRRLRMSELAAQSALTNSGLTRVVDRLVASGLVERQDCPTDRRGLFAAITPAGLATLTGVLPAHLTAIDEVLTGVLAPTELDAFTAALRKLRAVANPCSDPERPAAGEPR